MALTHVGTTTWVFGTGAVTPTLPSGTTTGDLVIMTLHSKYEDATLPSLPTGFSDLGGIANTGRPTGNDNGNTRSRAVYKVWQAGDSLPSLSPSNNNVSAAKVSTYRAAAYDVVGAPVVDDTVGTPLLLAASSNMGLKSGDILHADFCVNGDAPTWGTSTMTATGATLGTLTTNVADSSTTSGTDLRVRSVRASVTSGTATGNPQVSTALAGTTTTAVGTGVLIRIREVPPPSAPTSAPTAVADVEKIAITVPATLQGGADQYSIYRNGTTLVGSGYAAGQVGYDTIPNISMGTSYSYTVRGTNAAGESSNSPSSASRSPLPAPPSFILKGRSATGGKIDVQITTRPLYSAIYKIYRRPTSGGSFVLVHTSTSQSSGTTYTWSDTGVTTDTSYDYQVATSVSGVDSANSATQSATPIVQITYNIAYVVGNIASPPPGDDDFALYLQSLGHTTTWHSATGTANPATYDLAILSDSVSSTTLLNYAGVALPVVCFDSSWNSFGMTASAALQIGVSTDFVNHVGTAPANVGQRSGSQDVCTFAVGWYSVILDDLQGGVQALALHDDDPGKAVGIYANAGAQPNFRSAGRRVAIGNVGVLDSLNAVGKDWVADWIEWAATPPPPAAPAKVKVWNGSTWVECPVKVHDGSNWVTVPVK